MKKMLVVLMALLMTFSLVTSVSAQTVLKMSEVHAEGYPTTLADHEFARLVEEKTEGRIKVEVYSGGTLYGEETGAIEALQLGDLAFARVSASPVSNFVPALNAIQMPYLYKSGEHMWAILNGEIGQGFLAEIEKSPDSGLVGLCYYDAGSRSFYVTREVKTVGDMAGLKIRVQNNTMMVRMVELLGGAPITGIGPNDVQQAISTGTIDGAENNWPTYQNMGDYEAANYYILDQHTRVPEVLLASAEVMKSLDPADAEIIRQVAKDTQEYEIAEWAKKEAAAEAIVREAGTVVIELTPEARAEFEEKMAPLYEEFGSEWMDIINQIKEIGKDF
ncbi:MAG: TRAP transporter substrate-binding protein [Eubacteriales bacterium]|jgi:tripartite ATP-independent transporter DctP family solute receptor|nr:TRAP transporter substrate-binding protein [Eubacteriales bacterium]MDD4106128.1 TRAP transporter substrate-binding protein [Eubacteriales bacterium]MDD4711545.1 TRAP transporter substrate-binding protein [Eubacteriales bacterium]